MILKENRALNLVGRLLFASLMLSLVAAAASANDGGAWTVGKGEWYSEIRAERVSANQLFLPDSRDADIPYNTRFQSNRLVSYNELGWKKNVSFVFNLPLESNVWSSGPNQQSVTGLSDLVLALRVRLRDGSPGIVLDGGWKAPLGYEKDLFPTLGNGRQEGFTAINFGLSLPWIHGFAEAARGLRFIGEDGVLYTHTTVDVAGWVGSRVLIGARYNDQVPINSEASLSNLSSSFSAGPVLVFRVDDRIDLTAGSWHDWYGRNSLRENQVYVSFSIKKSKLNRLQGFLGSSKKP
jgi:hypothetical protein